VERGKEGLGLARPGPAQRAGVLAAGGRMVQKEGQAALEEPQGSPNPAGVSGAPLEPPGTAAGPVPGGEETDTETETALGSRRFLCGVVEGESSRKGCPTSLGDGGGWGWCLGGAWPQLALLLPVSSPGPGRCAVLGRGSLRWRGLGSGRSCCSRAGLLPLGLVLEAVR